MRHVCIVVLLVLYCNVMASDQLRRQATAVNPRRIVVRSLLFSEENDVFGDPLPANAAVETWVKLWKSYRNWQKSNMFERGSVIIPLELPSITVVRSVESGLVTATMMIAGKEVKYYAPYSYASYRRPMRVLETVESNDSDQSEELDHLRDLRVSRRFTAVNEDYGVFSKSCIGNKGEG